jgi:hypothetical protein
MTSPTIPPAAGPNPTPEALDETALLEAIRATFDPGNEDLAEYLRDKDPELYAERMAPVRRIIAAYLAVRPAPPPEQKPPVPQEGLIAAVVRAARAVDNAYVPRESQDLPPLEEMSRALDAYEAALTAQSGAPRLGASARVGADGATNAPSDIDAYRAGIIATGGSFAPLSDLAPEENPE